MNRIDLFIGTYALDTLCKTLWLQGPMNGIIPVVVQLIVPTGLSSFFDLICLR